ncbi:hypothetical protein [Streptomyces sp. CB02261]|uniref:hypothetical protein n=1 Tax=Streptomyces sp. CB02261 TaxID=1703940 RepID=UPI000ADB5C61|nr:hypothetical protein [Streptomyces sp. CB02261]
MFDPDVFVVWAAHQRSGRLASLVRDAAWASGTDSKSATRWISRLESLGLLSVDWIQGRWSALPCQITSLPDGTQTAVLTGTRPFDPGLCREAGAVTGQAGPAVDGIPLPAAVWFAYTSASQLHKWAASLGTEVTPCAAEARARKLAHFEPGPGAAPPARNSAAERLNPATGKFEAVDLSRNQPLPGLYKYQLYGSLPRYLLLRRPVRQTRQAPHTPALSGPGTWHTVGRREGIHAALPATVFPLRWTASPQSGGRGRRTLGCLTASWQAPLPLAQETTAVLCTGLAGTRTAQGDCYDGVPQHIAERIAFSLRRSLEIS